MSVQIVVIKSICAVFMSPITAISLYISHTVFEPSIFIVLIISVAISVHTLLALNIPNRIHDINLIFSPYTKGSFVYYAITDIL